MSLNKFLAVGQSFAGIRDEKSPYAMRKEGRLPTFNISPRFSRTEKPAVELVQTDWIEEPARAQKEIKVEPPPTPATRSEPVAVPAEKSDGRRWLRILTLGLFGREKRAKRLVQSELSLERVQVLRNDLADSDLELVLKKKRPARRILPEPVHTPKRQWDEMTARLFEIGQH